MGIYDRDYYRKDGPSFLGSFTGRGTACKWLIAINVILFVVQLIVPQVTDWFDLRLSSVDHWSDEEIVKTDTFRQELDRELGPGRVKLIESLPREQQEAIQKPIIEAIRKKFTEPGILQGHLWQLLTHAFLHAQSDIFHILFNMLFLWWFGHEMEEMYGVREFLLFYLAAAIAGGLGYFGWSLARGNLIPCLGASGAVTAVMVLYAFHYPTRVIRLWMILPIPIWLFVGFQVAQDTFVFASGMPTSTAVAGHLGGAAFGFAYYKTNWRFAPLWTRLTSFRLPGRRPRLRVYEEEAPAARRPRPAAAPVQTGVTTSPAPADEQLEAQVDAVLEKVARSGRESLSESEKALLVRASEVYKRRQRL